MNCETEVRRGPLATNWSRHPLALDVVLLMTDLGAPVGCHGQVIASQSRGRPGCRTTMTELSPHCTTGGQVELAGSGIRRREPNGIRDHTIIVHDQIGYGDWSRVKSGSSSSSGKAGHNNHTDELLGIG